MNFLLAHILAHAFTYSILAFYAVLGSTSLSHSAKAADLIPIEAFAALPSFTRAKLSPDGKQIGYVTDYQGRKHLVLQNLDGSDRLILPPD